MKEILTIVVLGSIVLAFACFDRPESSDMDDNMTSNLQGKLVLFVYGGWEGHNPEGCRDLYVPWLQQEGAQVMLSNSLDVYADSIVMQDVDLIIQTWTLGDISPSQLSGLLKTIQNGTGFAGWHGGVVDAFRGALDYHLMTGGQFLAHPGDFVQHTIHVADPDDPIMQDIHDFPIHTEQYYLITDPNIKVLATTTFSGNHLPWIDGRTMPVIWKNTYGQGRVFVNAIGHKIEDHSVPEFEKTMKRGIVWACR